MNDTVPPSFQWILLMAGANFPQSVPTPGLNDQGHLTLSSDSLVEPGTLVALVQVTGDPQGPRDTASCFRKRR